MGKKVENFKIYIGEGFPVEKALRKFKRISKKFGVGEDKSNQHHRKEACNLPGHGFSQQAGRGVHGCILCDEI